MTAKRIAGSISCCGLICGLCNQDGTCNCRTENHCGKRLSPDGCFQYACCSEKGYKGCWECPDFPCDKDMFTKDKIKIRAFVQCIKEDGLEAFSQYIIKNAEKGIVYHRNGIFGDYDLKNEADVLKLLRTGSV